MHDRKRSLRSGRLRSLNVGQEGVSEQSKQHFNITSTENDDETPLNDNSSLPKLLRGDTFQMSAIDKCKEWCTVEAPSPVPSLSQNASLGPPEGESEFSFSDSSRDTYDAQLKEVAGQVNSITNMMKMVFERLTPTVSAEEKKFMENMKAIFKIVPEGERGHFTTDVWNLALLYTRYLHPKLGINVVKHEGDLFCKEATDKSNM